MADDSREPQGANFVERWLMPFLRDSALWPILIVVLVHATILLAPALILAFRERSVGAMLALAAFFFLSFEGIRNEVRTRRRPGALTALTAIVWVGGGIVAWAADRVGLF
jgi:hypothetical protein